MSKIEEFLEWEDLKSFKFSLSSSENQEKLSKKTQSLMKSQENYFKSFTFIR